MKLIKVDNKNIKIFLNFYKSQYLNNPLKRDCLSGMLKGLLYNKSELCKTVELTPLMVVEDNKIIMICMLAYTSRMPDFIQIGFFEAIELNIKAFNLIFKEAEALAFNKNANKISASLNIHVNYGLGFLSSSYDKLQSFGMAHNPEFYHDFFTKSGFEPIEMVSYKKDMRKIDHILKKETSLKLREKYSVRESNFNDFKADCALYTDINNKSFSNHLFYYSRAKEEDYELLKEMKYLMKPENLLFVEKNNKTVGFMLWYPDYNQLMSVNETVGIKTVIKKKIFKKKIDTFKIVEMGVIPEERNKGAILALFDYCFECIKNEYSYMESGWILDNNFKSKSFGVRWADSESKKYKAYIKELL